jgi:hypothetical protein
MENELKNYYNSNLNNVACNASRIKEFDLTEISYKIGSGFSSGVLPKWVIGEYFIKACSVNSFGEDNYDAWNEVYINSI